MTTSLASTNPAVHATGVLPTPATVVAVLDTNVVLDLLLFRDPRGQALHQALSDQLLRWITTEQMLVELDWVLHRSALAAWGHDSALVMAQARRLCSTVPASAEGGSRVPRCTDPDDQMFIDLAWRWPAALLFSRDRALLRLARPARLHGLWIGTPEQWPAPIWPEAQKRRPKPPF